MNDDFLYSLRKEPPAQFAARLKGRLKSQDDDSARRFSVVRALLLGMLVGGSALAATLWAVHGGREERAQIVQSRSETEASPPTPFSRPAPTHDRGQSSRSSSVQPIEPTGTVSEPIRSPASQVAALDRAQPDAAEIGSASLGGLAISPSTSSARSQRTPWRPAIRIAGPASTLSFARNVDRSVDLAADIVDNDEAFARVCARPEAADAIFVTRRITQEELQRCDAHRANWLLEAKLGHIAVVVSSAKTAVPLPLTPRQLYLAVAKHVPDPTDPNRFVPNPNVTWRQIHSGFEDKTVTIFGPAAETQLARVFAELVMEPGCDTVPSIRALRTSNPAQYRRICHEVREDAAYTPILETEVFLTQTLWADPNAIAVLSFAFFDQHRAQLSGTLLGTETPTRETIEAGTYSSAAPIYIYSRQHRYGVMPAVQSYLNEFLRGSMTRGYLLSEGLILLDPSQRPSGMQRLERLDDR